MITAVAQALLMVHGADTAGYCRSRRADAIREARGWVGGVNAGAKLYYPLSPVFEDGYQIVLGKPGKETEQRARDGRIKNPHDMTPSVCLEGRILPIRPTFGEMVEHLKLLADDGGQGELEALELVGCLLYRNAFMLDHIEVAPGEWRYQPPQAVMDCIKSAAPWLGQMPAEAYLYLLEAIALNEDVKYNPNMEQTLGMKGRPNNCKTIARVTCVLLGHISWGTFFDQVLGGRGVSPLGKGEAHRLLPLLAGTRPLS